MYDPKRKIIQLIDFGLAKIINNNSCDHIKFIPGTEEYIPNDCVCTPAFDIYCCGVVLEKWYEHANLIMDDITKDLRNNLKNIDFTKRITASDALCHPFF